MGTDVYSENGRTGDFDAVLEQAERVKQDAAALASSANRLLAVRIRERPAQSLLIALAVGWLAGKYF